MGLIERRGEVSRAPRRLEAFFPDDDTDADARAAQCR
jgi:hypothetical protein